MKTCRTCNRTKPADAMLKARGVTMTDRYRKKPADQCPDGPRYKALGNFWAVPVVRWIGERINAVEQIKHERKAL